MPTIYRKTAKGLAEIATRANKLPPGLRNALILTDGRRSDVDLRALLPHASEDTLVLLAEQGFIEATGVVSGAWPPFPPVPPLQPLAPPPPGQPMPATAGPPAAAPAAPAPPRPALSLEQRRREAVRLLTDQLGPMADALAIRIERSRNADELRSALALAVQVLGNTRGRGAAEAFAARFADL
jgi:hypothetical protein